MCPNCLGQNASLSTTLQLVGLFLLVPPAVFLTVVLAIRKMTVLDGDPQRVPKAPRDGLRRAKPAYARRDQSVLPSVPPSGGGGGDQGG